jgi:hypothetical protein
MNVLLSIFFGLFLLGDVSANEFADQAEYERISSEMEKVGKKEIWVAVDKYFKDIEKLEVEIQFDHYVLGAQASQELGDILECRKRLDKALDLKPKRQKIRQWYTTIENDYGHVTLSTSKKDAFLERKDAVMDPVQAKAISFAQEKLAKKGKFEGLLPIGSYDFTGQKFLLEAGIAVQLDISPRMRRLELNKKQK